MEMDLDRAARLNCLMAAGGRCERCATSDGRLEWHHIITRAIRATRWRPENGVALCMTCHRWYHRSPRLGVAWFVEKYGQGRLDLLRMLRNGGG
jgi:5-methylcytosine-specific restriction endonuclease McrA